MKKLLLFTLLFLLTQVNAQTCFKSRTSLFVATSAQPLNITIADFNNDGKNDIATVNDYISSISVKLGDGIGNFGTAISRGTNGTPIDMAVADYNKDGILDMAVVNKSSTAITVSILIGTGTGSFNLLINYGPGSYPGSYVNATNPQITTADFNGDNNSDLAVTWEKGLVVYLGVGDGTFGSPTNYLGNIQFEDVIAKDFNKDRKTDLITTNGSYIYMFLGNGTGGFTLTGTTMVQSSAWACNDFNHDSIPDIVTATGEQSASVSLGIGNGTFNTSVDYNLNMGYDADGFVAADINGDGNIDIVASTSSGTANDLSVILGDGAGVFGNPILFDIGSDPSPLACGDLNSDNKPDFVFYDYFQYGYIWVLFQLTPPIALNLSGAAAICSGNSTTLTATGDAIHYTWSANAGSATTSTVSITPTISDTYTVTGVNGTCNNTQTISVTVNTTPTVNISGTTTICTGSSDTLNVAGATTYIWSSNAGSATTNSVIVTPTVSTTYTVTGTANSCNNIKTIAVGVYSLSVAGTASLCTGSSTTLTASGSTNYTWMPGGMTTASVVITPTTTTVYTVTGVAGNCNFVKTVTVTVYNHPTPIASASSPTVCSGSAVTLTGSGALSYTWAPGSITTATTNVMPTTATTTYTLTGKNGLCPVVTTTTSIQVHNIISITTATVCVGQTTTLTASGSSTYTWSVNAGSVNTATATGIANTGSIFTVTAADGTGCVATKTISPTVNQLPSVVFTSSLTTSNPNCYNFTNHSSACTTWAWSFGDGNTANTQTPAQHCYASTTTPYTVTLTGTDAHSCVNTESLVVQNSNSSNSAFNIGFDETNDFTGWQGYEGNNKNSNNTLTTVTGPITPPSYYNDDETASCNYFTLVNSGTEPIGKFSMASPLGGFAARLGGSTRNVSATGYGTACDDTPSGSQNNTAGEILQKTYTVTPANSYLQVAYAFVYTDDGSHLNGEQPYFRAQVLDASNNVISCLNLLQEGLNGVAPQHYLTDGNYNFYTNGYYTTAINLLPYIGQKVTIRFMVAGCTATAHYGFAYVDCLASSNPTITTSAIAICNSNTITLSVPSAGSFGTYTWSGPGIIGASNTQTIQANTSGTYSVSITNAQNCSFQLDTFINSSIPVALIATQQTVCAGQPITLTASGASTYTWSGNANSATTTSITITPNTSNAYTVTGTDVNGCTSTNTIAINVNAIPSILVLYNDVTCYGLNNGTAKASITGNSPYTYNWLPSGGNDSIANNLTPGNYTLTVSDINNCNTSSTLSINEPSLLSISAIQTTKDCGNSNGVATSATTGGTMPYLYVWSTTPQQVNSTAINLPAGIYTCAVADANGCSATANVTISDSCDMVWAGDANNDLIADNNDILAIGIGNITSGTTRNNATINWIAQPATNWINTLADGTNYKHIDCDGNGTINLSDTVAVIQNFNLTHPASKLSNNNPIVNASGVPLILVPQQNNILSGNFGVFNIMLGNSSILANNTYGVAFTMQYDNTYIDETSISINGNGSWLGAINNNMMAIALKNLPQSQTEFAITKTDHNNVNGQGKIGEITFKTLSNISNNSVTSFSITNANLISYNQTNIPVDLSAATSTVNIVNGTSDINQVASSNNINIYPNPNKGTFIIETNSIKKQTLQIFDVNGNIVLTQTISDKSIVDANNLISGVYNITITSSGNLINKRLVIVR